MEPGEDEEAESSFGGTHVHISWLTATAGNLPPSLWTLAGKSTRTSCFWLRHHILYRHMDK
jgi:hypothetical protein